jgi:SAM-dependent methyltransferase
MKSLLPPFTLRRVIASKVYHTLLGHSLENPFFRLTNFIDQTNARAYWSYRDKKIVCNVCGKQGFVLYDFPNPEHRAKHRIGLLRETLQCRSCGATMRNRALAHAFLSWISKEKLASAVECNSIAKISSLDVRVLDTDAYSAMGRILESFSLYVRSSYMPDLDFGSKIAHNLFNINLESIDFPDESFDIILSSDVAEHIRDIDRAHREIFRVLRPGGAYIFTVPFDPNCVDHHILVDTSSTSDRYLVPPQFHGDPLTGKILAYRVFGRGIFSDLQRIGFSVDFLSVVNDDAGIIDGDVFVASR